MSILVLFVILALIGFGAWALTRYIPMPQGIRTLIIVLAILIGILIALQALGVLGELRGAQVPRL